MFNCHISFDNFLKYFVLFIPCASLSGFFYLRILLTLRRGKQTGSKAHLARVLCLLWLSWVVVNVPLAVWEVAMQTFLEVGDGPNKDLMHWTPKRVDAIIFRALVLVSLAQSLNT